MALLLVLVSSIHSLAMTNYVIQPPGNAPPNINYQTPRAIRSPKFGGRSGLRFAMFGDWGMNTKAKDQTANGLFTIQKSLLRQGQGLNGVLLSGDNFYSKGVTSVDDSKWERLWGRPFRRVQVPFYVALGNHDYGYGVKNAQFQVDKSGTKGFELWRLRDENGPKELGIYFSQWFFSKGIACQVCFIDTSVLMVKTIRSKSAWAKQLHWLSKSLDDNPPRKGKNKSIVRMVIGHHVLQSFGEKEAEVKYINSNINRLGPHKAHLKDIIIKKADLYLGGHAHTVAYMNLSGKKVIPSKGPVHGRVRRLRAKAPLDLVSGSAAQTRQQSNWSDACYYVARIPGFTIIAIEKSGKKVTLHTHFVDCRLNNRPKIIYSLSMPMKSNRF
jgi:hypothetical protein